jgi:uncharacterized membrane protein
MIRNASIVLCLFAAACTTESGSGATCPSSDAPSYAGFARSFMTTYCSGCHSALAPNRYGAPPDLDFDTEAQLRVHAAEIDHEAAAGPNARNTDMPDLDGPVHAAPTMAERELLGEFLACERARR